MNESTLTPLVLLIIDRLAVIHNLVKKNKICSEQKEKNLVKVVQKNEE